MATTSLIQQFQQLGQARVAEVRTRGTRPKFGPAAVPLCAHKGSSLPVCGLKTPLWCEIWLVL